jgi:hypothetical protein
VEGQVIRRAALAALLLAGACTTSHPHKVVVGARAPSFRVLYRVLHTEAENHPTVAWELLTVQRPFLASDLNFKTKPNLDALGAPDSGSLTDVDHLYTYSGDALHVIAGRQPGLGAGDQALIEITNDAVARKLARVKQTAVVAGRSCTTVQFVEPPVGELAAFTKAKSHDDVCITRDGIILREQYTLNGRLLLTRQAVQITDVPDGAFDTSAAQDVTSGLPVPRVAPMEAGLTPPPTPNGYAADVAVDFFFPRPDAPTQLAYASKIWTFTKGASLITVELGAGQVVPWSRAHNRSVQLGANRASSVVRSDGIEIHWTNQDHWMRVRGPMPLVQLLAYARQVSSWDSSAAAAVPK